ncbi:Endoribonuclease XendoU-domain-containing protein [Gigaspora rosea]|uniref:Endoribonuclease XendoU-domain-containing protein n=1 Tax=Gigaspora rosea TaxID=44941 RepID=A0A397UMQ7_9GLOM|nr:Endoribonuclease XendoU-domain-containing protein [Gigaspora rosea]
MADESGVLRRAVSSATINDVPNPTQEELSNIGLAVQKLWELDKNRLEAGVDYTLNVFIAHGKDNSTPKPLFNHVDNKVNQLPTYKYFYALLDNYIPQTGIPEVVNDGEKKENERFLKACLQTGPMLYAFKYLKAKGAVKGSITDFENELNKIWFHMYRRQGHEEDSSSFEHVFLGEVGNGKAMAFHNWITFYFYEKVGRITFESLIPLKEGHNKHKNPSGNEHVINLRFSFEGAKKPYSTSFVGTSPEFELAMYSMLFLLKHSDTHVVLDDANLNLKIYPFDQDGMRYIVEAEMARTQKNKATSYHLGTLKAKLAKLLGFDVAKTGVARIGFVGFPSVGKSTLMSKLTGTFSAVAAYEFTTLTTVPGVLQYKGAKIQILDLPGIVEGAKDGRGRGRQVIAVARTCSLIYLVLDVLKPLTHKKIIETELEGFGIRLNKKPPNIYFKKKEKGGINMTNTVPLTYLDLDQVKAVLSEYKIHNADVNFKCDATVDDLIDVIEGRIYIPAIYVLNKIDQISIEELDLVYKIPHAVPISAHHEWNFDELLEKMWEYLNLIRIYTKPKGQLPDYSAPVVLRSSLCTVEDFCNSIHRGIVKKFKYALVWGSSAKHQPQKVGLSHVLADEDVVQLVKQ